MIGDGGHLVLAGPVEFSGPEIALMLLIVTSPALVVAIALALYVANHSAPGTRVAWGLVTFLAAFAVGLAVIWALFGTG